jgi:hypothetical protein
MTAHEKEWAVAKLLGELREMGLSAYEEMILFDRLARERGIIPTDEVDMAISDDDYDSDRSDGPSRPYQGPISDSESDGDRSDDSDRLPPRELTPDKGKSPVKSGRIVYTISALIGLIPAEPEFDNVRFLLGVKRVAFRFDPKLTNRQFKRAYLRTHKSLQGLKYLPRYKTILDGPEISLIVGKRKYPLTVYKPPFGGKPILPKIRKAKYVRTYIAEGPQKMAITVIKTKPKSRLRTTRRAFSAREARYKIGQLGGPSRTFISPPDTRHKKYWYFFRKRGAWHLSEHHPIGDELEVYDLNWS